MNSLSTRLGVASVVALLIGIAAPAQAWWNDAWSYRKAIALDGDAIGVDQASELADFPVAIRLHSGNFNFFLDTRSDGGDLRLIAGDDATPLAFHLENYDPLLGIGILWVKAPRLGSRGAPEKMHLYYGSPEARPAQDAAATYDRHYRAVFHFSEAEGAPRDATGYANHADASTWLPAVTGLLDRGIGAQGKESMTLPALAAPDPVEGGLTLATWVLIQEGASSGRVVSKGDPATGFALELRDATPVARLGMPAGLLEVVAARSLAVGRWQHLAVTIGGGTLTLYVNGTAAGSADVGQVSLPGPMTIGALGDLPGLVGAIDELQISDLARSAAWVAATANVHNPDSTVYTYFEDAAAEGDGLVGAYLQLMRVAVEKLSLDGWIIIGIIVLLGVVSVDVMIGKGIVLARTARADQRFLQDYRQHSRADLAAAIVAAGSAERAPDRSFAHSCLMSLYRAAIHAAHQLHDAHAAPQRLSAEELGVVRAAVDIRLVEEINRLNARLVLVTLAVSGGPFLGLLGTVLGVMITFTSVAASGDVNVATIAPGVASAMATTVVGLSVAIPSMFGYNFLATRITRISSLMEVFADQLLAQLASTGGVAADPSEAQHDAA